jgi:hypothetical protein
MGNHPGIAFSGCSDGDREPRIRQGDLPDDPGWVSHSPVTYQGPILKTYGVKETIISIAVASNGTEIRYRQFVHWCWSFDQISCIPKQDSHGRFQARQSHPDRGNSGTGWTFPRRMGLVHPPLLPAKMAAARAVVGQRMLDGLQLSEQISARRLDHQRVIAAVKHHCCVGLSFQGFSTPIGRDSFDSLLDSTGAADFRGEYPDAKHSDRLSANSAC